MTSRRPAPKAVTRRDVDRGDETLGLVRWTERHVQRWSTAARWTLLAAVLAGLFGMHVLTAEDGSSRHGDLPMIGASGPADMTGPTAAPDEPIPVLTDAIGNLPRVAAVMTADHGPGAGDHGAMAGCILFLVVGGPALILALLRRLHGDGMPGLGRLAGTAVTDVRRRGPPGRWTRLALCVIRVESTHPHDRPSLAGMWGLACPYQLPVQAQL